MSNQRIKLGDILVANRIISADQLDWALRLQEDNANPLTSILVQNGFVGEDLLLQLMAAQDNVSAWNLEKDRPDTEALSKLPAQICQKYQVLPVQIRGDLLLVAMRNPNDLETIEMIRNLTKMRVEPVLAGEDRLAQMIDYLHGDRHDGVTMDSHVDRAMSEINLDELSAHVKAPNAVLSEEDTRPVVALVNQIINDAIRLRASDIHIEPREKTIDLRYRVDGQLVKIREIPSQIQAMLTSRIKIMSELDIVEQRMPQDGRMNVHLDGRTVDLRVSCLPNVHGQRIVMRVLDKNVGLRRLEDLGFTHQNLGLFRSMIRKPYGLVLVTGPTGSGKTTTLYSALGEIRNGANNIMTCEDPVEYELPGINQSQVNEKIGLTFAAQLRATLRQDPDVILVGEIRDEETAQTAIRAALTGHLVVSTLHCNDAASAVPRLLDMGVDPFLLSTSLIGVVAQRLVRIMCPHCKQMGEPQGEDLAILKHYLGGATQNWDGGGFAIPPIHNSLGCDRCHQLGYRGRAAIHEIMTVTPHVAQHIARRATVDEIRAASERQGYRPIQLDALDRVVIGQTSMDECKRVVFFDTLEGSNNQGNFYNAA